MEESPVQELYRFRNLISDPDDIVIPARPETRRKTDQKYTYAFVIAVVILLPFLVYTMMYADLQNLVGTDNCGNFCGFKNKKYDEWNCTGQDFTDEKYLVINGIEKTCMRSCPFPTHGLMSCRDNLEVNPAKDLREFYKDLEDGWWVIALSLLVTCSLCFGMILLFRHAVEFLVWFLLIGGIGVLAIAAGVSWQAYFRYADSPDVKDKNSAQSFLKLSFTLSLIVLVMVILLTCFIKRVKLIIELFKEAAKAIFEIPGLLSLPILTFTAVFLSIITFVVLTLYMFTARKLVQVMPNSVDYEPNGAMIFAMIYNFFVFLWLSIFMTGAQYMIISGAVAAWFFTRNKNYLDRPLLTSFNNFIKFHLGSVFIGSLIIAIVTFIKMLLRALSSNRRTSWIVECCCNELIAFLKLFSKNAYIQTAMHGEPFFKSGSRAVKLLVSNAENVIAINSLGDFVLVIAQILLIVVGGVIGFLIAQASGNKNYVAIGTICIVLTFVMVTTFFGIFEATIDSIFMCFCEDSLLNDGMARPYFMSKGLRQLIENCKGIIPAKKQRE